MGWLTVTRLEQILLMHRASTARIFTENSTHRCLNFSAKIYQATKATHLRAGNEPLKTS